MVMETQILYLKWILSHFYSLQNLLHNQTKCNLCAVWTIENLFQEISHQIRDSRLTKCLGEASDKIKEAMLMVNLNKDRNVTIYSRYFASITFNRLLPAHNFTYVHHMWKCGLVRQKLIWWHPFLFWASSWCVSCRNIRGVVTTTA